MVKNYLYLIFASCMIALSAILHLHFSSENFTVLGRFSRLFVITRIVHSVEYLPG